LKNRKTSVACPDYLNFHGEYLDSNRSAGGSSRLGAGPQSCRPCAGPGNVSTAPQPAAPHWP
jgi:hypothetical protein